MNEPVMMEIQIQDASFLEETMMQWMITILQGIMIYEVLYSFSSMLILVVYINYCQYNNQMVVN